VNATYLRIDLLRQLRDTGNLMFVVLMPAVMYLVFGVSLGSGEEAAGSGNVRFYVMASMAAYGAALAATSVTGSAAVEQLQGWGRQVALTPARPAGLVAGKVAVALAITSVAVLVVYLLGGLTGASADGPLIWMQTFLITLAGAGMFGLFGFAVATLGKSESALGVATGVLVLMSFVGNVFTPLSGGMLDFARFTPMYGYVGLVRWPQLEGTLASGAGSDELWVLVANFVAWALVFGAAAVLGVRRGRRRQ